MVHTGTLIYRLYMLILESGHNNVDNAANLKGSLYVQN
jgi:hypothetical protein